MNATPTNVVRTSAGTWKDWPMPAGYGVRTLDFGPIRGSGLGADLSELAPGLSSCPLHWHLLEEENFYLLEGRLTVRELCEGLYREFDLQPGDLLTYPPNTRVAHQFVNTGTVPARWISMSDQAPGEVAFYPTSAKWGMRTLKRRGRVAGGPAASDPPAIMPQLAEPPNRARTEAVAEVLRDGVGARSLSRSATARRVRADVERYPPGCATRLHLRSANDEVLYLLSGTLEVEQWHGRRDDLGVAVFDDPRRERFSLSPGDVVCWPASAPVAHRVVNASAEDSVALVFGLDRLEDATYFPETGEVSVPGLGLHGVWQDLAYWVDEKPPR